LQALIEIEDLSKSFRQGREAVTVLKDLDFKLKESEFVTIVGRSGSGKSTFLDLIMGLTQPSSGTIHWAKPHFSTGYAFQKPALLPWRSVYRNVSLPLEIDNVPKHKHRDMILHALHEVGLEYAANMFPYQLSGGMAQRVAIARALVHDPDLLLMDEPFGALDPLLRDNLNVNLVKLWERTRKNILFVTHSINEAVILSDRILILEEGRFIKSFTIKIPRPRGFETFHSREFARIARQIREHMPIQPNLPRTVQ